LVSTEAEPVRWQSRVSPLLLPAILFVSVFSIYFATAEREGVNVDAYAASAGAWRLATAGTPWFDELDVTQIGGTHVGGGVQRNGQWILPSANGHVNVQRMPGPILAGLPFYWLFGESGTDEGDFSLEPAAIASSWITASAVLLLFLAVRRNAPETHALAVALAFAFATPSWSVSANGLWTHPITQLGIAGAAYGASRRNWWMVGAFFAMGMWGRPHLAVIAAIAGLGIAWCRRDWRVALKAGAPTIVSLGLLSGWNRAVHGTWSISSTYGDVVDRATHGVEATLGHDLLLNYVGFLFAFNRGLLVWTPALLIFIPALLRARRELPDWSIWLAVGGLVYTFLQIRLAEFSGGIFFYGYRHGLELVTCLVPAFAFAVPHLGSLARRLLPILLALQVATISVGALTEGFFVPPESMWRENAFWLALRNNPELLSAYLALALTIGAAVAFRRTAATDNRGQSAAIVDCDESARANRSTS
jgi:alpha-1,2-mannosyltransferase